MKKSSATKLRARGLDQRGLEKAAGGRGIVKGYMLCQYCDQTTDYQWENCPSCGVGRDFALAHYQVRVPGSVVR